MKALKRRIDKLIRRPVDRITSFQMTDEADADRVKAAMLAKGFELVREVGGFRLWRT